LIVTVAQRLRTQHLIDNAGSNPVRYILNFFCIF
jgi:hypothetical protein